MENILLIDMDNYFSRIFHMSRKFNCNKIESEDEELNCILENSLKTIGYFNNLKKYNNYSDIIFVYDTKTSKNNNKILFEEFIKKYNIKSEGYKGTRTGNMNFIKFKTYFQNLLFFSGYTLIGSELYEADDIIATKALKLAKEGKNIHILSNDKDMYQILNDNISIIKGISQKDRENPFTNTDFIFNYMTKYKINIEPSDIINIKAIVGDKSDNILGISGIGEKTLFKEIEKYGSIENTEIFKKHKDFILDLRKIIELKTDIQNFELQIQEGIKNEKKYNGYLLSILK